MRRTPSRIMITTFVLVLAGIGFYPGCPAAQDATDPAAEKSGLSAAASAEAAGEPAGAGAVSTAKGPDDWFDKGILLSVYGNYDAAVRAFQKALETAPDWGAAHFQMGVAYGEMGNYSAALTAMNRAIALEPGRGDFHYGRGRIYLLTGDTGKAREDLEAAARLGNRDAVKYLEK